ncbi:lysophospholipase [Burkholderiales bacterium JOSHI_001]|nr:lysophospholipase [Burkholderiales bacterium JOSHI_001]
MSSRSAEPMPPGRLGLRHRAHTASRGPLWSALAVALAAAGCAPAGPRALESATENLRHCLEAGVATGAALSYLRAGDPSGPRVILVHGTPGSATAWADYLLQPPPGLELLALDRPGFGRSGPEGAVTGLAEQAAAVLALMPDDGRPVLLLGHSLGGPVVARVAAEHPGRVAALVLLSASLDPELERIHPMQRLGAWGPVSHLLPRALRNANAELMALQPELQALAALLPRISAKVVIVHGTKDDLVPVANVPYMQARLTGARCVQTTLLEGRNHFLPWNSEDAVRDAIRLALEPAC